MQTSDHASDRTLELHNRSSLPATAFTHVRTLCVSLIQSLQSFVPTSMVQLDPREDLDQSRNGSVSAQLTYSKSPADGEQLYIYVNALANGGKRTNFETGSFTLPVTNLRTIRPFTLTRNGFQLETLQHPSEVRWEKEDQVGSCIEFHMRDDWLQLAAAN